MDKRVEEIVRDVYDKNPELIERYRAGDDLAGEELVQLNTPLIYSIAGRFRDRGADMSDLVEMGTLGFVKALRTFDLSRGFAFSTYAVPLIFGEIRRFLRDDGIIKVSREEKRLCAMLNRERERRVALGESTDLRAIAEAVGVSVQDAASAMFSEAPIRSLEESVFDDDDSVTLGSTLADDDEASRSFERVALRFAIEKLSEMHKSIVMLRFFRDLSQSETARILGVSQVKVSREEKKVMAFLKKELE